MRVKPAPSSRTEIAHSGAKSWRPACFPSGSVTFGDRAPRDPCLEVRESFNSRRWIRGFVRERIRARSPWSVCVTRHPRDQARPPHLTRISAVFNSKADRRTLSAIRLLERAFPAPRRARSACTRFVSRPSCPRRSSLNPRARGRCGNGTESETSRIWGEVTGPRAERRLLLGRQYRRVGAVIGSHRPGRRAATCATSAGPTVASRRILDLVPSPRVADRPRLVDTRGSMRSFF